MNGEAPPVPENCPSCNKPFYVNGRWQGGLTLQFWEDGVLYFPEWLCLECHTIANEMLNSNRISVVAEHLAEIGLLCSCCAEKFGAVCTEEPEDG